MQAALVMAAKQHDSQVEAAAEAVAVGGSFTLGTGEAKVDEAEGTAAASPLVGALALDTDIDE